MSYVNKKASVQIVPLSSEHVSLYAEVIRRSFATEARAYMLTIENCPSHTSFITDDRLAAKFKGRYYPFGCYADGEMIGFASLTDMGNGIFEMNHVAILPEYRHFGYGTDMLSFCKQMAISLGGEKINIGIIEENAVLKAWYLANGFVHTGTAHIAHLPFTVGFMSFVTKQSSY